jgi:hypothetical protein
LSKQEHGYEISVAVDKQHLFVGYAGMMEHMKKFIADK